MNAQIIKNIGIFAAGVFISGAITETFHQRCVEIYFGDARHWTTSKKFRLPIFQTEKEAKRLRLKMECKILCRMFKKNGQRCITVKELYDYAEVKNIGNIPKELEAHGWSVNDILEAKIIPYSEGIGYVIDLPHPSLLNNSKGDPYFDMPDSTPISVELKPKKKGVRNEKVKK